MLVLNLRLVAVKLPSIDVTLVGARLVSVQSSDAGSKSIRPMNVNTLNGLTFSILEA